MLKRWLKNPLVWINLLSAILIVILLMRSTGVEALILVFISALLLISVGFRVRLEKLNLLNIKILEDTVREHAGELVETYQKLNSEIEETKRFKEALFRTETKFRNLVNNSPDGILLTDETGVVIEWNNGMTSITGIDRFDALGNYYWDMRAKTIPEEFRDDKFELYNYTFFKDLLEHGNSDVLDVNSLSETTIVAVNGIQRVLQVKNFTIPSATGFKIASITRDVTSEYYKDNAIRENAELLRAIFENTLQAFILLDINGYVLDFNKITQIRALDIFNRTISKGDLIFDFLAQAEGKSLEKLFQTALTENVKVEMNLQFPGKPDHWFEFYLIALRNDENELIGVFANIFDIHDRKMAEQETLTALVKEKELNRLKSHFVSAVSHEFRTPLASIYSNVQLLHRYFSKWEEAKREQTFLRIYDSVKHMTALLQDVSLVGKGQSGMQKFDPVNAEVVQLCRLVIDETQVALEYRDRVVFSSEISELEAIIDKNITKHILVNILNNALKYSPEDEKVIFVLRHKAPNLLVFEITDKGIGMGEKDLKNIFEPFYRAHNVGNVSGTGLGMAIVKQCVDVHNGKISIESEPGHGTRVTVQLPYMALPSEM
jgi:PAS domain S-box-containing protein